MHNSELTRISADMEVRRKATSIILSMTSGRNVEEVVQFLKKQLQKTQEADFDKVRRVCSFVHAKN
jgi:vesicle coat complex subunit